MKLKLLTLALSASALNGQPAKNCCCKNGEQEKVTVPKIPQYDQQVTVEVVPSETDYNGYGDYNDRSDQYQPAQRQDGVTKYQAEYTPEDYQYEEDQNQGQTPETNLSIGGGNCHTCTEADKPKEWANMDFCFKQHETADNKFYKCVMGVPHEFTCALGTYWNHAGFVCDHRKGGNPDTEHRAAQVKEDCPCARN